MILAQNLFKSFPRNLRKFNQISSFSVMASDIKRNKKARTTAGIIGKKLSNNFLYIYFDIDLNERII